MRNWCAALWAAFLSLSTAMPVLSQDVTIRSKDGTIELDATMLGFDGDFYRLQTEYGELTVASADVHCDGTGCPSLTDYVTELTIVGAATPGATLLPALLDSFSERLQYSVEKTQTGSQRFTYEITDPAQGRVIGRFHFDLSTTEAGFEHLITEGADMVFALREIRPDEASRARKQGLGRLREAHRSRVIGLNAMVPIVAEVNPLEHVSMTQLSDLLSGSTDNWQGLGGPDAGVTLHLLSRENGLSQSLEDQLLRPVDAEFGGDIRWHDTTDALSAAVAQDPLGIGLTSLSAVGNSKAVAISGSCGFQIRATRRTVKTEDYPLTTPLFIYMPARRMPALARDFITFTRSLSAQIVIRRAGFVDQSPEEVPVNLQGDRFANAISVAEGPAGFAALQDMARTLRGLQRLTTSFRFEPGSARLDAQSRSNVLQLVRSLEIGQYDGRQLYFVGFSDGQGPAHANRDIAAHRANSVRLAVSNHIEPSQLERFQIDTLAYGEALPMACDDTEWDRQVNRRVEVWIK